MHPGFITVLAACGVAIAKAIPNESLSPIQVGYSETGPWTAAGGFKLPNYKTIGLWKHVVNETTSTVTSTFLGNLTAAESNDANVPKIDTAIPPWPSHSSVATCYHQHYIADHVAIAQEELGNWCDANGNSYKIGENTNYSFAYIDVAVFVCSWAQTIKNQCGSDQLDSALDQCSADCGAGFTCSDAYSPWYKAYGIVPPSGSVCNQGPVNS